MWLKFKLSLEDAMRSAAVIPRPSDAAADVAAGAAAVDSTVVDEGECRADAEASLVAREAEDATDGELVGQEQLAAPPSRIHQIFVTANPILRNSVAKSFRSLQSGFVASLDPTTGGQVPEQEEELTDLAHVSELGWPLFLRAHQWLRLLDQSLPQHERFFSESEGLAAFARRGADGWHTERGGLSELPDLDLDEDDEDYDDEEEGSVWGGDERDGAEAAAVCSGDGAPGGARAAAREEVTFEMFERTLWPLMVGKDKPQAAQRGLRELKQQAQAKDLRDKVARSALKASVVFREIVSYIKGSAQALESESGCLSRAEYLSLGRKVAPAFEKGDGDSTDGSGGRSQVYDMYLKYEAWKEQCGAYDVMDACASIYGALARQGGYKGPRIDEIYVDEVQDFTQAELLLFLEACSDKNALLFTGDTCQTIARGVGFRFEELTTMFYNLRERQLRHLQVRGVQLADVPREQLCQVPEVSKLSVNYRTHNGILGAASEMVTLLLELFPSSVDQLKKDVGHFDGPRPVLLTDTTKDDLSILLCGSDPAHSQIEFGAHQAVLVRNQAAKDRLPTELQTALVLTIFEAKGLEFDEVFVFDFFADSPADEKTWRVITSCLERQQREMQRQPRGSNSDDTGDARLSRTSDDGEARTEMLQAPRAVDFNKGAHSLLNEELKMLYTAITRARVKVVIYDQHKQKRAPMFHFLLAKHPPLAVVFDSKQAKSGLAKSSTPEEWCAQAKNLMRNKLFEIAALCYKKGDDSRGMTAALAMAHYQRDELLRAARCFELAGHTPHAASCLRRAGEYMLAAQAYRKLGKRAAEARVLALAAGKAVGRKEAVELYSAAASAWDAAGKPAQAVLLRLSHKELRREGLEVVRADTALFRMALPHMERLKLFDAAHDVCAKLGELGKAEELAQASAFHHKKKGDREAMLAAVKCFRSSEHQLSFLLKHGDRSQVVDLLLSRDQKHDALDELLIGGDFVRAAEIAGDAQPGAEHGGQAGDQARLVSAIAARASDDVRLMASFLGPAGHGAWAAANGAEPSDSGLDKSPLVQLFVLDRLREKVLAKGVQVRNDSVLRCVEQLHWMEDALSAACCFLSLASSEAEAYTLSFLRIQGSHGKPKPRMPTWRWLCTLASHDPQKILLGESGAMAVLVAQAIFTACVPWLERFGAVADDAQGILLRSEAKAPSEPIQMPGRGVSEQYTQLLQLEFKVQLAARRLDRHLGTGAKPRGSVEYRVHGLCSAERKRVDVTVSRIMSVIVPETSDAALSPDYLGRLPHACHPAARAAFTGCLSALITADPHARDEVITWLEKYLKRCATPQPENVLLHLEATATIWHTMQLCAMPFQFEARLRNLIKNDRQRNRGRGLVMDMYPNPNSSRPGDDNHPSFLLHYLHTYERQAQLLQACRPMVDYLQLCINGLRQGTISQRLSACTCIELLERLCCYTLSVTSTCKASANEVWLPLSLVDTHIRARKMRTPWLQNAVNSAYPQAMQALGAALSSSLTLGMLGVTPQQLWGVASLRYGRLAVERTAIVLLCVLGHQMRSGFAPIHDLVQQQVQDPLSSFAQASQLVGTHLMPPVEADRLRTFGQAVGACLQAAKASDVQTFMCQLQVLLARRGDALVAVSWPSSWGLSSPRAYFDSADGDMDALATVVSSIRTAKQKYQPTDVLRELEREAGWCGIGRSQV